MFYVKICQFSIGLERFKDGQKIWCIYCNVIFAVFAPNQDGTWNLQWNDVLVWNNLNKKHANGTVYWHLFSGLSGKSQILFALVFSTRYLDLILTFISVYNTVMKIIYLVCSYATVYLMLVKFKATYDSNHDTFRIEFLLIPVAGLACLVNHEFSVLEVSPSNFVVIN